VSLRLRLAAAFALVALITAAAVALATPVIVGRGFAQIETGATPGPGQGSGRGPGPLAGIHAQQIQQETTVTLIAIAIAAAAGASLLGLLLARRIAEPLDRLGVAAAAVAHGELGRRSGLGDRSDEIGSLGRSFDAMADDLERAEAARRRFFQDVVHELKTPLAVIDATTMAVLDGVYDHDDRHLLTIRDQSRLLARIVDDLRTIGLAESGDLPLRVSTIALDDLAGGSVRAFTARAAAAGIAVGLQVPSGLVVRGDVDRLSQALGALLDNAIRHTPDGGSVSVEGGRVGSRVRLAVRDTGPGIAPEDLPHLFDRFYQADPARDRSAGTTGLGLAIVRALVSAHGGTTGAENLAGGGGARFWMDLDPAGPAAGPAGP
jgi:two-component system, OmpR family, sensor histidine kinase BaeS